MERDWKKEAEVWERRTHAMSEVADLLLDAAKFAAGTSTDPSGFLEKFRPAFEALIAIGRRPDLEGPDATDTSFREKIGAAKEARFEDIRKAFNAEMERRGRGERIVGFVLGEGPPKPIPNVLAMAPWTKEKAESLGDYFLEIADKTSETDASDILLRAVAVYRSFVLHAASGGQVKFVREGEKDRVLKVRIR